MKNVQAALFIIFLSLSINAQEPKWLSEIKKIIPMQSTEQDVVKLFGKPKEQNGNSFSYKTETGYLEIEYATGTCDSRISPYLAPKGIVVELSFELKGNLNFNKLNLDINKFGRDESNDTSHARYLSLELGRAYDTEIKYYKKDGENKIKEILRSIDIFLPKSYDHLDCINFK